MKKFSKLKESLAELDEKIKQAKASADTEENARFYELVNLVYDLNRATREYLHELERELYDHASVQNGHLPRIKGAGAMEKALKALGMDEDYTVEKSVIYSVASRGGAPEFVIELRKE